MRDSKRRPSLGRHERSRAELTLSARSASRLYAQASSYDELHAKLKQKLHLFDPDMDRTFKLSVQCSHHKIPGQRHL